MSSPSEPVEIVSVSTAFWFLPRRMIEPLPNARSICDSAASSALLLSTDVPSTRQRLACDTADPPSARSAAKPQQRPLAEYVHGLFSSASSFFVLASFCDIEICVAGAAPALTYEAGNARPR